ncbi:HAD family hydrolase [Actinoallomurus sp. NPDC050550]|uniref:HAD family hydrolase n=1 Tax=Actinoallomurus sp. NPDC050550 TaxID=3154937 RepID=UPI0033D580FA
MNSRPNDWVLGDDIVAAVFGVDGVIIDIVRPCAAAWKWVLDPFLRSYALVREAEFTPFDIDDDYMRHMYAKSRLDGIRDFLTSRDVMLPYDDLRGLACRAEEVFLAGVRRSGIAVVDSTVTMIRTARRRGIRTAAVSADRHATELLSSAGVAELFDVRLDGLDAPGIRLPAHCEPGLLLEAARRLDAPPIRTAVVDESLAAMSAGRCAGFGLVVGVDHIGRAATLRGHGADVVVTDLSQIPVLEPAMA